MPFVRWVALLCGTMLVAGCATSGTPVGDDVERIILISIDTLRADALGSYGAARDPTPTLDRLAGEGVRFRNCIAPAPHTFPSHATLLTGLHPLEHGVLTNAYGVLPPSVRTLAERLRDRGWVTGAVVSSDVLHRRYGLDRGFQEYRDDFFANMLTLGDRKFVAEADASQTTRTAIEWLEHAPAGAPLLLFIHYMDPHAPYVPPQPFAGRFEQSPYLGEVAYVDHHIGRLLDYVHSAGLETGTLTIVTSDHGESLGAHGESTHGYFLYDEVIRVPLILHGAGVGSRRVVDKTVGLIDIVPTVLAVLGMEADPSLSGLPVMGAVPPDRPLFSVSYVPALAHGWSPLWSLWTAGEKLILAPRKEYYRTDSDPGELDNQFGRSAQRAARLEGMLREMAAAYLARRDEPRRLVLDSQSRQQLAALGYGSGPGDTWDRPLDDFSGPDPKDMVEVIELLRRYYRARSGNDVAAAQALLDAVRERDPQNPVPDNETSLLFLLTGRYQELLDWMATRSVAFRSDTIQAYRKAVALGKLGRHDEAIETLRQNLQRDPGHRESRYELAALMASRPGAAAGERQAALDEYRRLLADDQMNTAARNNLATLLFQHGQVDAAREELERLVTDDPRNALAQHNLGLVYARLALTEKALEALEAYLRLAADAPDRAEIEGAIRVLRSRLAGQGRMPAQP